MAETYLITGFPRLIAKLVIRRIYEEEPQATIFFLHQNKFRHDAEKFAAEIATGRSSGPGSENSEKAGKKKSPPDSRRSARARLIALEGDVASMDLGLSGDEYNLLRKKLTCIQHMATVSHLSVKPKIMQVVNVVGTQHCLELALSCAKFKRFVFHSTAFVSGMRTGVVLEEELECHQSFNNPFESSQFQAERVVCFIMFCAPITILRPMIMVGTSDSGEIDRMEGFYYLLNAMLNLSSDVLIYLPAWGENPFNVVLVDYYVYAAWILSKKKAVIGKCFHLTDLQLVMARRAFEILAQCSGRALFKSPFGALLTRRVASQLLRIPGLERTFRSHRDYLDQFDRLVVYNCINTLELLESSGLHCPRFEDYA